jgi:hypothetical protein
MVGDVGRLSHGAGLAFPSRFSLEQLRLPREQHRIDALGISGNQDELRASGDEGGIKL